MTTFKCFPSNFSQMSYLIIRSLSRKQSKSFKKSFNLKITLQDFFSAATCMILTDPKIVAEVKSSLDKKIKLRIEIKKIIENQTTTKKLLHLLNARKML